MLTKNESPQVSFIIRTIPGRGALLANALASVARQTVSNWEIVVVEDGGETARAQAEAHPNTRYISLPPVGRCRAGNAALDAAKGTYCGFLDDDDELYPNHLETLLPLLESNPDTPAAFALADIFYGTRKESPRPAPPFWTLRTRNIMPIQAVLFRRSLFTAHGGLAEDLDHFEDWELWLRYASRGGAFVHAPRVTSFYRMPADTRGYHRRVLTAQRYYPVVALRVKDYEFRGEGQGLALLPPRAALKERLLRSYYFFALFRRLSSVYKRCKAFVSER
ncbi:MAG: glycosyltransferase [Holosporales bacterium]